MEPDSIIYPVIGTSTNVSPVSNNRSAVVPLIAIVTNFIVFYDN